MLRSSSIRGSIVDCRLFGTVVDGQLVNGWRRTCYSSISIPLLLQFCEAGIRKGWIRLDAVFAVIAVGQVRLNGCVFVFVITAQCKRNLLDPSIWPAISIDW